MHVALYNHARTDAVLDLGGTLRVIPAQGFWSVDQNLVPHILERAQTEGLDLRTEPIVKVSTADAAAVAAQHIITAGLVPLALFTDEDLGRCKRDTLLALAAHLNLTHEAAASNRALIAILKAHIAGSSNGRTPGHPPGDAGSIPATAPNLTAAPQAEPPPSGGEQNTPATHTAPASTAVNAQE